MATAQPIPPPAAAACRYCGVPLSSLQRFGGGTCAAMDCRRRAVDEACKARRDAEIAGLLATATVSPAGRGEATPLSGLPVVWIDEHAPRTVRLSAARREAQRQHLRRQIQLLAAAAAEPASPEPEPDAASQRGSQLCAFCGGRCCRWGANSFAFIRAPQLKRWLDEHPGSDAADAVDAYMTRLPKRHVEGSCVHHARTGCTLPREMRSETCNRYGCDGLRRVETLNEQGPQSVVAAMQHHLTLKRAVLLDEGGASPIRSPRAWQPDDTDGVAGSGATRSR